MPASDELDVVLEQYHLALLEIVKGDSGPLKEMYSQQEDVTVANPFGMIKRGWPDVGETIDRAAALYRDGEVVGFEQMTRFVVPDLACIVEMERFKAKVAGRDEVAPLALRVTSTFRREAGGWRVVHRHADPLTTARPPESVIQT